MNGLERKKNLGIPHSFVEFCNFCLEVGALVSQESELADVARLVAVRIVVTQFGCRVESRESQITKQKNKTETKKKGHHDYAAAAEFEVSELCIQHELYPSSWGTHTVEFRILQRRENKVRQDARGKARCQRMKLYCEEERSMVGALFVAVIVPTEKGPRFQGVLVRDSWFFF